jgi:uncharacterized SAM-binding protein YcdF (DUF218 family)
MTGARRLATGCLAAGVAALGLGFVDFAATLTTAETRPVDHADGLVVLTGGADRVSDAVTLLADGRADRLLITGVNPSTSLADLARSRPQLRTLVDCCVTLGYRALDTAGNAQETAEWVTDHKIRSLIVVTSNYHMPRALAEISHVVHGVRLYAYPVVTGAARDVPWWSNPQRTRLLVSEYLKYIVVMAKHTLWPRPATGGQTIVARGDP